MNTMNPGELRSWRRDLGFGAVAIAAVIATSLAGQIATYPNLTPWFDSLNKPSFNPPSAVFPEIWTTLYGIMTFALWRVLRKRPDSTERHVALILFFIQLALNAAWSWMFFWMHSPLLGLANIVPQLLIVVATIHAFWKVDRIAAWCLVPLAAWVAFATVLNFSIWWLNR
jgi:tryptophan-rich sensory protein